jgi:hypothetical protein
MTSLDVDVLTVRKIYAKGNNAILPANTVLTTDGLGGTTWTSLNSIAGGSGFNSIVTSGSTFNSSPGNTQFSILDNSNIGLIPTSATAATLYSKSFGQVDVVGQNSINSFNTTNGTFNNKLNFIPNGALTISTNTATNQIFFFSPNDAISSMSSLIKNMSNLNTTITNGLASFNSPLSGILYTALSSFSTALGPTVTTTSFANTLSTNTNASFFTNTLNTSTINMSGVRQPFIQYGSNGIITGSTVVTLNRSYANNNYVIQLTYLNNPGGLVAPLSFSGATNSNFTVHGDLFTNFHWTTYGNVF